MRRLAAATSVVTEGSRLCEEGAAKIVGKRELVVRMLMTGPSYKRCRNSVHGREESRHARDQLHLATDLQLTVDVFDMDTDGLFGKSEEMCNIRNSVPPSEKPCDL